MQLQLPLLSALVAIFLINAQSFAGESIVLEASYFHKREQKSSVKVFKSPIELRIPEKLTIKSGLGKIKAHLIFEIDKEKDDSSNKKDTPANQVYLYNQIAIKLLFSFKCFAGFGADFNLFAGFGTKFVAFS